MPHAGYTAVTIRRKAKEDLVAMQVALAKELGKPVSHSDLIFELRKRFDLGCLNINHAPPKQVVDALMHLDGDDLQDVLEELCVRMGFTLQNTTYDVHKEARQ
jgi:hypothetical protein